MSSSVSEQRRGRSRGTLTVATLSLVTVVVLVWALGGFGYRQDLFTATGPGSLITTGPYEFRFTEATVQHRRQGNDYQVVVSGEGRTTGDTSIQPMTGDAGFLGAQAKATREFRSSYAVNLGRADYSSLRLRFFTPGLAPVPVFVTFQFSADPGDAVRMIVFGQRYTTPYVFGSEEGWQQTRSASHLLLPLRVLPESEY